MVSFWNANDWSNDNTTDYTLRSSAICTNTSWVPCPGCLENNTRYKDFVTNDRIAFSVDSDIELTFILKNNCELPSGFGLVTLISLGFIFITMYLFMYFQSVQANKLDVSQETSTDYSIEIKVRSEVKYHDAYGSHIYSSSLVWRRTHHQNQKILMNGRHSLKQSLTAYKSPIAQ